MNQINVGKNISLRDLTFAEEIMPLNLLESRGGLSMFILMRKPQQPRSVCTLQGTALLSCGRAMKIHCTYN